jgi:hypothetical protein
MNNAKKEDIKWINVVMVLLGELILGFFIFGIYPVVTMLFLGEGAGSLLYSNGNKVAWALIPILIPTLINLTSIFNAVKNNNRNKLKTFKLIQMILLILYIPFVVWRYFTFGFHI